MPETNAPLSEPLLIACLCAQWCGTCKEYAPLFESLQAEFPGASFRWIDIEDESDLVDPIEVDNFPTLLIVRSGQPRFFGTILPHLQTLRRLIQSHTDGSTPALPSTDLQTLARKLQVAVG